MELIKDHFYKVFKPYKIEVRYGHHVTIDEDTIVKCVSNGTLRYRGFEFVPVKSEIELYFDDVTKINPVNWDQVRADAAISAMNAIISNSDLYAIMRAGSINSSQLINDINSKALQYADDLIKKLKGN